MDESGAVTNPRVERYLLQIADGIDATQAWVKGQGFSNDGGGKKYRQSVERSPAFIARKKALVEEREALMATKDPYDEIVWQARQLWRVARTTDDMQGMTKATQMLFDVAEKRNKGAPAMANGPGRPPIENPQTASPERRDSIRKLVGAFPPPRPQGETA